MRRAAAVLLFLMLAGDSAALYAQEIWSPLRWLSSVLFAPLPIKIRIIDLLVVALLVASMSRKDAKGPRVRPMRGAMFLAAGAVTLMFVYGLARGGDVRAASWQVYLLLSSILAAFAFASVCKTSQHYLVLGKALVAAGIYRATMELVFYIGWVRNSGKETPAHLTTHDDTVLWIVCITYLLINLVESRTRKAKLWAMGLIPFFLVAVQLNNRRLAWVSLVFSLIVFYFAQRPSKAKRRIFQGALAMVPVIGLYVIVGWGRPERIFKPLKSLETIATKEDDSTKARNVENLGLIATSNAYGLLTGPGWGHRYIEVSSKYSIAEYFELWPFIPHNSILGIFAFTGDIGFIGFW
ncbi:MAG: O-antigen ligase family protein, partial [Polyangiales bacterium]